MVNERQPQRMIKRLRIMRSWVLVSLTTTLGKNYDIMFTVVSVTTTTFWGKVENHYDNGDKLTLKVSGINDGKSNWTTK